MVPSRRSGFTLVELLVVITIICVLIMLLLPALMGVWQTVYATQCQHNLNSIFQAMVLWQQQKSSVVFPHGPGWNGSLLPYCENRMDIFLCPASAGPLDMSSGEGTYADPNKPPPQNGGGDSGGSENSNPPVLPDFDVSFDVFSDHNCSNFLWNVSFNSRWCRVTYNYAVTSFKNTRGESKPDPKDSDMTPAYTYRYQIEDRGFLVEQTGDWKWADDYADIDVAVTYQGTTPILVKVLQFKAGSQGYRYNMLINGQVTIKNIDNHAGMVMDLRPDSQQTDPNNPPDPSNPPLPITPSVTSKYTYFPSDYGMSVGSYSATITPGDASSGIKSVLQDVPRVDGKLFLLLDYPKRLADYNEDGEDYYGDYGDACGSGKYFITDPLRWKEQYFPNNEVNWRQYQALRHFKTANVLFCDGHVEALYYNFDPGSKEEKTGKYLKKNSPLWVYGKPVTSY
jgi:prepilin-type N-terminal cleavage/methylation domain-containing protein/prepilin-type processing-associated H-X9-DG protein